MSKYRICIRIRVFYCDIRITDKHLKIHHYRGGQAGRATFIARLFLYMVKSPQKQNLPKEGEKKKLKRGRIFPTGNKDAKTGRVFSKGDKI